MIPPKAASIVLLRAAERLGGVEKLATRLGVRPGVLRLQIAGDAPVTEVEYLAAVDIVLGESAARGDGSSNDPKPNHRE